MEHLQQSFNLKFEYKVYFTAGLFDIPNTLFNDYLREEAVPQIPRKILFVIDRGVIEAGTDLISKVQEYFERSRKKA